REALDSSKTLSIGSSKSGGTIETLSHFKYFWSKAGRGEQFVAITDPGSPLEQLAHEHGFRRVFPGEPEIGGRYSALSNFGLVPAAGMGADLEALLDGAEGAAPGCRPADTSAGEPRLWRGGTLGRV